MKSPAVVLRRLLACLLLGTSLLALLPLPVQAHVALQSSTQIDEEIERIRASLTSQERVGQLMLVTFEGTYLGPDSAIAQLIHAYNIGGVVLLAENDNINGQVNTPRLVQSLTGDLQQLADQAAQATIGRGVPREFIPLFIATQDGGNSLPGTQIAVDTTPLPSLMSLGATWNTEYTRQVGQIAGRELSAMGINLLLGPPLDVFQRPLAGRGLDLGVDSFGGSAYWVGKLAQAYISGVHEGSANRIAVVADHFPGLGFADTLPDEEIPVVPRSIDELRRIDLLPYAAVTGEADSPAARVDGLQCANLRYQGASLRSSTRPICVDEQAAADLLNLDPFHAWRDHGLLISSSLGTRAMRRYYNSRPFPHRQVARDAFLAGNDLLYLADFGPQPGDDPFDNIVDVIRFFAEQYDKDPVFRAEVDQSLTRILRLKLALYGGDFTLSNVLASGIDIAVVGQSSAQIYTIAQHSLNLIAPRRESLPPPPERDDTIVIFTDVRQVQQCSACAAFPPISANALEGAIERMYGPYAGGQIRPDHVTSFSFSQLQSYLSANLEGEGMADDSSTFKTNQRIGEALRSVDWIVFVMLDVSPGWPASTAVQQFLESEARVVSRAHVVGFALGAPIYLSSTEISKFAAYYGLYSSIPPYVDAAARALFQEADFAGAPPISIPAVGYDLDDITAPDPSQVIALEIESLQGQPVTNHPAAEPLAMPAGARLILRTGPILDRNGHPVPDNTAVEFTLNFITDNLQTRQYGATRDGVAYTSFTPGRPGRVQITASSQDAVRSTAFQIVVSDTAGQIGAPPGDAASTPGTAPAADAASPGTEAALAPTPAASSGPAPGAPVSSTPASAERDLETQQLAVLDFVLSLFGLALMSGLGFAIGLSMTLSVDGGIRVVLGSFVAGLAGYIYYGLGGPGARALAALVQDLAPMVATLGAGLAGMLITWWTLRRPRRAR